MNPKDLLPLTTKDSSVPQFLKLVLGFRLALSHCTGGRHFSNWAISPALRIIHFLVLSLGTWTPRAVLSSGHCSPALPAPHRSHCWPVMKGGWSSETVLMPGVTSWCWKRLLHPGQRSTYWQGSGTHLLTLSERPKEKIITNTNTDRHTQPQSLCVDSI